MRPLCFVAVAASLLTFNIGHTYASDILKNQGFRVCLDNSDIKVERMELEFDRASKSIKFDVAGSSTKQVNVTAVIEIVAYGMSFDYSFNPCDEKTFVAQLCPLPAGRFSAKDQQKIPAEFADKIPAIAFSIPDLDAEATLKLINEDGDDVACIQSVVSNGESVEVPAVSYVAAGIAGAALVLTGLSALAGSGHPGATTPSPTFGEMIGWFQTMSMSGMLSVEYPQVYRSFTKNFGFSMGLIPWTQMQTSIDSFRNVTGGNLTENSVQFLRNATLIFSNGENARAKRSLSSLLEPVFLYPRVETSVNGTGSGNETQSTGVNHIVNGIHGYVEQLSIPEANTFMTALLIFGIIVAAIATGILLVKVILEVWALMSSFPKKLTDFRKHYWGLLARTITNLILILYGVWTLYCIFQFTRGDSWAAKLLAGVTLAIFTGILGWFTFKIWTLARRYKKQTGTTEGLYQDKETWRKYSLFYDHYKKDYWWIFVPIIVYLFARGCIIAGGDGNGLVQTAGQFALEAVMLILLIWARPFETKSGQWINISIQVVRVLSVACILVFVQQLGLSQTTKTITGVVLIGVQTALTGILVILMIINACILCFGKNPHAKRQKESEKHDKDLDDLTPLDARQSLLMPTKRASPQDEEAGKLNHLAQYEPYRDIPLTNTSHSRTASLEPLIHAQSTSQMKRLSQQSDVRSSLYSDPNAYQHPSRP
ncbi:hypothetical protein FQN57_002717 [Myotisia sp. PD_48]|nr:hypothetical protein FQN57_002717 [Myotisia sp. PD_48]